MQKNLAKSKPKGLGLATTKSVAETLADLKFAVSGLIELCLEFDRGNASVVGEITAKLRELVHDTSKEPSHLAYAVTGDLKFSKNKMLFKNTCAQFDPKRPVTDLHFISLVVEPQPRYLAPLGEATAATLHREGFEPWWVKRTVALDAAGNRLSRKDIVLAVAHHSDPVGHDAADPQDTTLDPGPACVRQIAHELVVTLERVAPECVVTEYKPRSLAERQAL